jgi:hypothetical protein
MKKSLLIFMKIYLLDVDWMVEIQTAMLDEKHPLHFIPLANENLVI